jgi:hypothetical protein
MKDTILNKVIRFCLRRCCVDALTARMVIHKLSKGEVRYYLNEYDEVETYWKEHKNPFKRH